jgi:uncharacterized membrane protein
VQQQQPPQQKQVQQQVQWQQVVGLQQGSEAGAALTAVQQQQMPSPGTHQQRVRLILQGSSQQALIPLPETAHQQRLQLQLQGWVSVLVVLLLLQRLRVGMGSQAGQTSAAAAADMLVLVWDSRRDLLQVGLHA